MSWYGQGFESVPYPYRGQGKVRWDGHQLEGELRELGGVEVMPGRIKEVGRCGEVVAVRECECCGDARPGSGTFREVRRSCGGRSCPYCSWVRAQERVELLKYAAEEGVAEVEGYEWQLLTQSLRYEVDRDSWDMGIEGLRHRIMLCKRIGRELWKERLKQPGAAMLRCVEISVRGHVHQHMVYYGPPVDPGWMGEVGLKVSRGRGCLATAKRIKGGKKGVANATRYAAKGVKGSAAAAFNEDVLTGEKMGEFLYYKLAARWELAAFRQRLTETYGALRQLDPPKPDDPGCVHDDSYVQCEKCGVIGRFRTAYRPVYSYLMDCHLKGKAGIEGNRWLPYWAREAAWKKKQKQREERRLAQQKVAR